MLKKAIDQYLPGNIGKWECPGGAIENETPEKCVLRETKEETGLECKIIRELPTLSVESKKYSSNCRVYLLEAPSDEVTLSEEHSEKKWVFPGDVKTFALSKFAGLLLEYFNNPKEYLD